MKDYEKYLNPETGAKLIEILDGNKLVAKVNITFKKISIKHYPNSYMNEVGLDEKGNKRYPLYFRILFNKQSVKIKSAIARNYSKNEFELEKLSEEDKSYMRREALILTYIVSGTYTKTIQEASKDFNVEMEFIRKSFDINSLFKNFSITQFELPKLIENKLLDIIMSEAESETYKDDILNILQYSNEINAYHLLQFLKLKDKDKWDNFEKWYHPKLWFFNFYYYDFISSFKEYKYSGITSMDLKFNILKETTNRGEDSTSKIASSLSFEDKFYSVFSGEDFFGIIGSIKLLLRIEENK